MSKKFFSGDCSHYTATECRKHVHLERQYALLDLWEDNVSLIASMPIKTIHVSFTNCFCPSNYCCLVEDACDGLGETSGPYLSRSIAPILDSSWKVQERWLSKVLVCWKRRCWASTNGQTLMRISVVRDAMLEGRSLTRGTAPTFQSTRRKNLDVKLDPLVRRISMSACKIAPSFGLKQQGS